MQKRAFTLIELLIVVAIVSILALIAVPNLLEAQTRAKVSRVHGDLNTISKGLQAYRLDQENYPISVSFSSRTILPHLLRLKPLTTPVAYLGSIPNDIFLMPLQKPYSYLEKYGYEETERYQGENPPLKGMEISFFANGNNWVIASVGPRRTRPDMNDGYGQEDAYDPTNGTVSLGSPLMFGP